jgi:hypothetical protein
MALLHRIDTEFTDDQLGRLFARLYDAGFGLVLVAPTGYLTARELVVEVGRRVATGARVRRATPAGHVRTRAVYDTYWRDLYKVRSEGRLGNGPFILLAAVQTEAA